MNYYSNEIVFRGHPDKVCDQISDCLLDNYLKKDPDSRCGIEVMGGKGKIFITGEVTSTADVNVTQVVKDVLADVGYDENAYEIVNNLGVQSADIAQGVDIGGAGDQGMMFGYACRDTKEMLPTAQMILIKLSKWYDENQKGDGRFLPDGKAQITGCYEDGKILRSIKDFTISYQNTEVNREETDKIIREKAIEICQEYGITKIEAFHINPTGKFLIGGFDGDAGLTGRKIVVDNYQSFANVGGGAFSGKDPSKVDRSAAYKARQIAKRVVNSDSLIYWCEVQISYAIGIAQPLAIYINTNLGQKIAYADTYEECKPANIIKEFDLKKPIYMATAQYGHFGNTGFAWEKI